jgi:hypothetical protein
VSPHGEVSPHFPSGSPARRMRTGGVSLCTRALPQLASHEKRAHAVLAHVGERHRRAATLVEHPSYQNRNCYDSGNDQGGRKQQYSTSGDCTKNVALLSLQSSSRTHRTVNADALKHPAAWAFMASSKTARMGAGKWVESTSMISAG